ncbi:TetR family transcriptional regulator [Jatrophihabitans sp. GAS493]|uniref:TetR/AcrR family transcriptional regulator n=1 Tax=Jatrophihabitans sp. GAS493 TaxID=1907575 RepID=UPI000BB78D5A|nr:TetR/AcrR family transcriptional regulator [Jatrophihabitans sp. GAS493]SOD74947.1 TetR family transcriptional regulator [Jatrophihabitans sp. GAS493]
MTRQAVPRIPAGDRAERKRQAIVQAAHDVFIRDGFEAGIDLIAAEAGVSKVTIYNHFGSKEGLFLAVIGDALSEALGGAVAGTQARLNSSDDLRESLIWTAQAWVEGMTRPDVLALRHLVVSEVRRFPELGAAWRGNGPDRAQPALAATFQRLIDQGRLQMPDIELACIQLYALVLYPHLVHSAYGDSLSRATTDALITSGVDMFLGYHHYRPTTTTKRDTAAAPTKATAPTKASAPKKAGR